MEFPRRLVRRGLERIDTLYHRIYHLRAVGPLLYLGLEPYRGAAIDFPDGTHLESGSLIGRLHFNNARAAAVQANGRLQAGVRFARLLRDSCAELAWLASSDESVGNVQLYEGVTWFRPHGSAVGFQTQIVPSGLRQRWLSAHFKLLIWAFAPAAQAAAIADVEPRVFRITRRALIESFASKTHVAAS